MRSNHVRSGARRGPAAPVPAGATLLTSEPLKLSKEQQQQIKGLVPQIAKVLPSLGLNGPTQENAEAYVRSVRSGETSKIDKLVRLLRDHGAGDQALGRELAGIVDPEGKRYPPFAPPEDNGNTAGEPPAPDSVDEERSQPPEPTGSQTAEIIRHLGQRHSRTVDPGNARDCLAEVA